MSRGIGMSSPPRFPAFSKRFFFFILRRRDKVVNMLPCNLPALWMQVVASSPALTFA
jgi:hypothetical protein